MDLAALVAEVNDSAGLDVPDARVKIWLNERYRRLAARSDFTKRIQNIGPTVIDQAVYTLPDDVADIHSLRIGEGQTYYRIGHRQAWRVSAGYGTSGYYFSPEWTSAGARQIRVHPVPDTADTEISVLVSFYPDPLVDDTDEPIIPEEFHRALVDGALAEGYMHEEDRPDLAQLHEQKFQDWIELLRRHGNARVGSGSFSLNVVR